MGTAELLGSSSHVIKLSYAVTAAIFKTIGPQNLLFVESCSYSAYCTPVYSRNNFGGYRGGKKKRQVV